MMLFLYMPYTKFAHIVYRTIALAFERYRESSFAVKDSLTAIFPAVKSRNFNEFRLFSMVKARSRCINLIISLRNQSVIGIIEST